MTTATRIADATGGQRGNVDTFGEALRRRREERGLTQIVLARTIGVDSSSLWRWESGKHEPIPVIRYALRCALGLSEHDDGGWWEVGW